MSLKLEIRLDFALPMMMTKKKFIKEIASSGLRIRPRSNLFSN